MASVAAFDGGSSAGGLAAGWVLAAVAAEDAPVVDVAALLRFVVSV